MYSLPEWAKAVPSPAFVLDKQRLIRNLELIRSVRQGAGVEIILALKGFALWHVFPLLREYLDGATASSLNEALLIREHMGLKAHTYAVAYKEESFPQIVRHSQHLSFNTLSQYHRFKDYLKGKPVSCGLRINPEQSDVTVDLYNPSSPNSRLGELQENMPEQLPEGIEGLHFHVLCESSAQSLEKVLEAVETRFGHWLPQVKWINMGGGHLMTRAGYDVEHLVRILKAFKEKHQLQIILEPGSAIAWQTGELVATVLDIHQGRDLQTAILDVSFTAHMPDTLEMPYRPKIFGAVDPAPGDTRHLYRMGGVSCLAGDFMEPYAFAQELKVGDRIVLDDMMHYTMVKTTLFNGVEHPSIYMRDEADTLQELRRFYYADYLDRLG
ncbi:MAG: carboxynorspermidine decarboxylase [Phaeodactylibacter sp.]|nr:carboxynorspermidine decarboxylase [Phaeodactylibacter sp.]